MPKKLVVITGVSKGIGKSIASEFIKKGEFTVIGCARNTQTIASLSNKYPGHSFNVVDVSDYRAVQLWLNDIVKNYGIPDIVMNNAAILNPKKLFEDEPIDYYHKVMNINFFSMVYINHILLKHIKQTKPQKEIKILNFTSINGLKGFEYNVGYNATKHAIEGLSKSLAKELPANILMCAYDPGIVSTKMLSDFTDGDKTIQRGATPVEKWGELNYDFIVSQLNRDEHNGKHVFGVDTIRSCIDAFGIPKQFFDEYKQFAKL